MRSALGLALGLGRGFTGGFDTYQTLGALTPAQVTDSDAVLADLWIRVGQQNSIIDEARRAGFNADLVSQLTATGTSLMARIEALSVQRDGISSAQYAEWRDRLASFGTEVMLFEQAVQTDVGSGAAARNWKIAGATAGALAVAGLIGTVIWYVTKGGG
jgi:hypothetical protein